MASLGDFAKLPVEIRVQIYLHLFIPAKRNLYHGGLKMFDPWPKNGSWESPVPSAVLLRVSKHLNAETASILYSGNCFKFDNPKYFHAFTKDIGRSNASLLADVEICERMPQFSLKSFSAALQTAPRLRRVHIHSHLMSCAPAYRSPSVLLFLKALQPMLAEHPTLEQVMSHHVGGHLKSYWTGGWRSRWQNVCYENGARLPKWEAFEVTMVAGHCDELGDGYVFDLDGEIQWLHRRLSMFPETAKVMKELLDLEPLPLKPVTRFLSRYLVEAQ